MVHRSNRNFADSIIKAGKKVEQATQQLSSWVELDDASIKFSTGETMGVKHTRAVMKLGPQALAGFGALHGDRTITLLSSTFPTGAVISLSTGTRNSLTTMLIYAPSSVDSRVVGIAREVPDESSTFEALLQGDLLSHSSGSLLKDAALLEGAAWFVARAVESV